VDLQREVDYTNQAQMRVTADTGILEEVASLTVPAGAGVLLPAVVIRLRSVVQGAVELPRRSPRDYLASLSANWTAPAIISYTIIGRTLYLTPSPSLDTDLVITYTRRSAETSSDDSLEVSGEYARVCERLVGAYALLDDGQPELAAQALSDYDADVQRLRLRAQRRGRGISSSRIRLGGVNP
jgi:hypothetical protein